MISKKLRLKLRRSSYDLILNVSIVYAAIDSLVWLNIRILVNSFFCINIISEREFVTYYRKQRKKVRTNPWELNCFGRLGGVGGPSSHRRLRPPKLDKSFGTFKTGTSVLEKLTGTVCLRKRKTPTGM